MKRKGVLGLTGSEIIWWAVALLLVFIGIIGTQLLSDKGGSALNSIRTAIGLG